MGQTTATDPSINTEDDIMAAPKTSKKPKQKKLPVEAAKGFLTSSAHDEDSSS